jgi:hypothetical protein
MSRVLEIHSIAFAGDQLLVEATIEDAVLVRPQTHLDPPEWGPAICTGTLTLTDDMLVPATDSQLAQLLSEQVEDWAPLHPDEFWEGA